MKRIIILFICIFIICSCEKKEQMNIQEYYLTYNSIDIKPGAMFSTVAISLDDYNNTHSETSDYNENTANIYEYDNFEIETFYDEDGIEKIYSIRLTNENQPTNEGVKIGDNIDNMLDIYGSDYINVDDSIYLYTIDNTNISFTIENNYIVEIVYYLV